MASQAAVRQVCVRVRPPPPRSETSDFLRRCASLPQLRHGFAEIGALAARCRRTANLGDGIPHRISASNSAWFRHRLSRARARGSGSGLVWFGTVWLGTVGYCSLTHVCTCFTRALHVRCTRRFVSCCGVIRGVVVRGALLAHALRVRAPASNQLAGVGVPVVDRVPVSDLVEKPSGDKRVDERIGIAGPLAGIGDDIVLKPPELPIVGVIHAPPPEGMQVPDRVDTRHVQQPGEVPGFRVAEQLLVRFDPRHQATSSSGCVVINCRSTSGGQLRWRTRYSHRTYSISDMDRDAPNWSRASAFSDTTTTAHVSGQ